MNALRTFKSALLCLAFSAHAAWTAAAACPWTGTFNKIPESGQVPPSYEHIVEALHKQKGCSTGAITNGGAAVVIAANGDGGFAALPPQLKKVLEANQQRGQKIADIHITESGKYIVILGRNAYNTLGAPEEMVKHIKTVRTKGGAILAAAFNDAGHFLVVTDETVYFKLSKGGSEKLKRAKELYGNVLHASMTDTSFVLCCERGVYLYNAPKSLRSALDELEFAPRCIKYTDDGDYLITDGERLFSYSL